MRPSALHFTIDIYIKTYLDIYNSETALQLIRKPCGLTGLDTRAPHG